MLALLLQTGQVSGLSRHPVKHTMLRCPLTMFHMKPLGSHQMSTYSCTRNV